jgi:hypothetical protein
MSHQFSHHNENFAEGMMKMDKLMDNQIRIKKNLLLETFDEE